MSLLDQLDKNNIPKHIAIIMDGNGRWAKKQGELRSFGHHSGINSVRDTLEASVELGVDFLTLYAFSTENWNRPIEEINVLMQILVDSLEKEKPVFMKNNIQLKTIGDITQLPANCQSQLAKIITDTSKNTGLTLILALSYSGRWDLVNAMKNIAQQLNQGSISEENITEDLITSSLSTSKYPDPDLLIRTSGEYRISNFLLWQIAYSEIYITPVLWPEFSKNNLVEAIASFQSRERRYGKTSEQLDSKENKNSNA
jgi:undecaprenyl diphosphate synthase